MRVVLDIEANGLKPTKIWCIVCKDIDTGEVHVFKTPTDSKEVRESFLDYSKTVALWIGHNIITYDLPVLVDLCGIEPITPTSNKVIDTLVISRLLHYARPNGHSIEAYGEEFELPKIEYNDWSKYTEEMLEYCIRDVEICHRIYNSFTGGRIDRIGNTLNPVWKSSIDCEQRFEAITSDISNNGFCFNSNKCAKLLDKVTNELSEVDKDILDVFPPRPVIVREFTPKATKFGTINRTSVPRSLWDNIENYEVGKTYQQTKLVEFNPDSHKQIIEVLNEAGWQPLDKTKTHIETEREFKKTKNPILKEKLNALSVYGWKINETNINTLPKSAPLPARTLGKRITLESRRRTLTEWSNLVDPSDNRIHGRFYSIGSWTHRMAHQEPNTANIPNEHDTQGKVKLYGGEMRSLWQAPPGKLLVGVDAEGIQLRIFAHYIDDEEFTNALVTGRKEDKTDPHSLNQKVLGSVCKSRAAAKRFIYALLLGAGMHKLSTVLEASILQTEEALSRLLQRYQGFATLKQTQIPRDAKRGYFFGLDGRAVKILGDSEGQRRHLCMSGYLQNGEAVVMKHATLLWYERLRARGIDFQLVDMVHDEWQTECPNDTDIALAIAREQALAIKETGERLGLKCPLAGSYINEKLLEKGHPFPYTIGTNWKVTH